VTDKPNNPPAFSEVVAANGCKPWLTAGKKYVVDGGADPSADPSAGLFCVVDDDGDKIFCKFKDCAHLNGGDWALVENGSKP